MRPLDNSACFEAKEGKSSPYSHDFTLGRGSSAGFVLDRFMAARTLCRLEVETAEHWLRLKGKELALKLL